MKLTSDQLEVIHKYIDPTIIDRDKLIQYLEKHEHLVEISQLTPIVNPEEKTLGIIETHNTPGAHRIKYSKGKQCQELYSTSLARQFRQVMAISVSTSRRL